jgi:general secretion pathway protein E
MVLNEIRDLDLKPYIPDGLNIHHLLKNNLLFSKKDDQSFVAIMTSKNLTKSVSYFNKINIDKCEAVFVDQDSFDRLYNLFFDIKKDNDITKFNSKDKEHSDVNEDYSLSEFLKISSDIMTNEESAPIIKFVNAIFFQAIKKKASDIHIETYESFGEVRFRIDGLLFKTIDLEKNIVNLVISRIKVISNLDISEKRLPQDGRTQIKIANETLDVRISIIPTYYGERVVMRILMQNSSIPRIGELGFNSETTDKIRSMLNNPHGIILVTGPTGSGKSTSLHSFIKEIKTPEKNIITVEDPVEYKSDGISQIQVNEKVGLTFSSALRSILRQDPDVIMVGEIRDEDTANIAVRSALTGHLVFSTLHTNSAVNTISRLSDMGIKPFLLSSSIIGILSQRLVRIICNSCKKPEKDLYDKNKMMGFPISTRIYTHCGCKECNYTGFIGRKSVGEIIIFDDKIRNLLKETIDENTILSSIENFKSLDNQLKDMIQNGETSIDEALRIGMKF